MPIRDEELALRANRHLAVWEEAPLGRVLGHAQGRDEVEVWWIVLVRYRDGSWGAASLADLQETAREEPATLGRPVGEVSSVRPAWAVEREDLSTGEARDRARTAPGGVLVVLSAGRLAGVLVEGRKRNSAPSWAFEVGPVEPLGSLLIEGEEPELPEVAEEERFTDVFCPDQVWTGAPRFTAGLQLTVEPATFSRATLRTWVRPGRVRVELQAPGCEILGPARRELEVRPGEDSAALAYHLVPGAPGFRTLTFDLFQGSHPLGTVSFPLEVTAERIGGGTVKAAPLRLPRYDGAAQPERVLRVVRDPGSGVLQFTLVTHGATSWLNFPPVSLTREPAEYAAGLFADFAPDLPSEERTGGSAAERGGLALAPDDLERRLRSLGHALWSEIVPPELQALYAEERDEWRDRSLMVLSDEPYIPWEVVWPYGDGWRDEEPWCLSLLFSRWLRRDARVRSNPGAPGVLPVRSLACLAPTDSGLPAADRERDYLLALTREHGLADLSPRPAGWREVMARLSAGGYDWFHAAAHGRFSPRSQPMPGQLALEGDQVLTPSHLADPEIEAHLRKVRPGFVFNACESGRLGWRLTGLGGWAETLVSGGAGLFLGPLWVVNDRLALIAVEELYRRLLAGEEVAEACRAARRAARRPGDPTWLAYSLYAHPHARLRPRAA